MIAKKHPESVAGRLASVTAIADAHERWLPLLHQRVESLETAILQHRNAEVQRLCDDLLANGTKLGASSFQDAAHDVARRFFAGDVTGAYATAHTIEERLDLFAASVERKIATFARAASAYRRTSNLPVHGVSPGDQHRLFSIDLHRVAHRFGDDLHAFYTFAREHALPELRSAIEELRQGIARGSDAMVEQSCERGREIAATIGARTVHAGINLIERSYREGGPMTLELLHDTQQELAAVTHWVAAPSRH